MLSGRYPMHINGLVENLDEIVLESVNQLKRFHIMV